MNFNSSRALSRRTFLRASGVAVGLPLLDAMLPRSAAWGAAPDAPPRRMLLICTNMGMMPQFFAPETAGRDYRPSDYLELIKEHRDDFTVFSGVSHPDVDGGHNSEVSFLTAAPHPSAGGFKNSISLDQFAAERVGTRTRFPYLSLTVGSEQNGQSYTAAGVKIPPEDKPSEVFKKLFVGGGRSEAETQVNRLREGRSVLDVVAGQAKTLAKRLGSSDRAKVDQYLTSVRELEGRMVAAEAWEHRPRPVTDAPLPTDIDDRNALIPRTRLMFDMARLAMEADGTRIISITIDENHNPKPNIPGVNLGHHSLTHHGHREETIAELKLIESAQMSVFGELLTGLKSAKEQGDSLLDRTMVLYGSNIGNANSHDNRNMPILLAGGGFRHGTHLAFDKQNNYPLPNLFVSMLQRMGVEVDRFASSTGTMRGLDFA